MTLREKQFLYFAIIACFLTGSGMFVLKNFFETIGEFGFEEHWAIGYFKNIHYAMTPFLVVSFGLLWQGHISKGVKNKKRKKRYSGLFILFVMVLLVFSGQLMLSVIETGIRNWVGWVHSAAGLLITIGIFRHAFKSS